MALLKRNALALLLASCLVLAACGRGTTGLIKQRPVPAGPATLTTTTGLPVFPGNRHPSNLVTDSAMASDCEQAGPGITFMGDAALFSPGPSQAACVLYASDTTGGVPPTASFLFEGSRTTGAWIAIADYTTQRWEFHGPYAATDVVRIDLTGGDNYASPNNNLWVAVIAPPGGKALFRVMTFGAVDPTNQPPVASFTIQVDSAAAPQNVLVFGSASGDPDGHILEWDWDWDGDGVFDKFDNGGNDSYLYPGLGTSITLRVIDDQLATATLTLPVHYNATPHAVLTPSASVGDPLSQVNLDASGSSDPDGTIAHYAWDLDGNGVFGEPGAEAAAADSSTTSINLGATPGLQQVSVQVTDDKGAQDQTSQTLTARGWRVADVDATTGCIFPSMQMLNGYPAMAYECSPADEIRFALNSAADGSGTWTTTTVHAEPSGNPYWPHLAIVNGLPAIGYTDIFEDKLCYAHTAQADGSSGWSVDDVDPGVAVDGASSLAVGNTGPMLSYHDKDNGHVRFAYNSAADGSGTWTTLAVDTSADATGSYSAVALIDGKPAISYSDEASGGVNYAYSSQADGSSGWTVVPVFATGSGPGIGKLTELGGLPAFSCLENNEPLLATSTQSDGSSGWSTLEPDPVRLAADAGNLAVIGGTLDLVYDEETMPPPPHIIFNRCSTADGTGTWTPVSISSNGITPDISEYGGRVAVAYATFGGGLKVAVLFE